MVFLKDFFENKKNTQTTKSMQNYPACKELNQNIKKGHLLDFLPSIQLVTAQQHTTYITGDLLATINSKDRDKVRRLLRYMAVLIKKNIKEKRCLSYVMIFRHNI